MASLNIITYNKKLVTKGKYLDLIAIGILFLILIPGLSGNLAMSICILFMITFLLANSLINFAANNITEVGRIIIGENSTTITVSEKTRVLENRKVKVKFSRKGFKGENNYTPLSNFGAFTLKSGINTITFYDGADKFTYDILIESREQYAAVIDNIKERFAH